MAPKAAPQNVPQGATGSTGSSDTGRKTPQQIIDEALKGYQSIPVGAVAPASRTAIGVEGTEQVDPMTGQRTGYYGYTRPVTVIPGGGGRPGTTNNKPLYFSGDEDMITKFSKENIALIQRSLAMNSLMSSNYIPGVVDDKTRSGFRELLGIANRQTTDWQTALATVSQASQAGVGGAKMPSYQLTNPDDLKAVFRKAAQDSLGRNLQDGDLNRLIRAYQQEELQYQKKVSAGGVAVEAPSAQTFAANAIEQDFSGEVNQNKMDNIFSAVDRALSGGQ